MSEPTFKERLSRPYLSIGEKIVTLSGSAAAIILLVIKLTGGGS